jgi:PAS domain S-box-containing protein
MATRDLAAGNLSARVSFSGRHDEISSLGQAFDEMAEAIEDQTNERERAEAALRESEERLRMALSARQMGTFRMDMTRRVVFMDERLRELHGFPPDKVEVGLEEAMERIHPDDRALMIATIEQTARDEPAKQLEFRVILPDGSIRWLAGWGRLLGSHAPGQIVGVHYDITTRKEAVEKLRVNEDRLRLALHASQAGVWERNLRTREEVWSPENFDLYGLDPSKGMLSNHDWERLLHPDDLAGARKAYDDIIAGRAAEFHWEFRINHPVRGQRWLLGLGRVFRNKAGMAESLIGINLDITERKQREVEQAALAAIVENSADAIVGMTLDGFITSWNRGAEQLFGYAASEVIGRHISLILPAERMHDYEVVMGRIRKGEKIAHFESVRRTKDGRMIDVSLTVSPIRNAHGDVVGLSKIAHDISVRKHSEEKLREAKDAAEAANRLKGEFLANMSHEIRTPMHALIGMLDLLIREELSSDRRTSLEMAKSSASSLLRLLEEILALSKIEAGQAQVRCVEFSLDACLRDSVGTLAGLATSRGLALDWKVASGIPDLLNGDDIRLGQVLSNLVNNAIKFTRQGGVEVVVNRTGGTDQEIELHFAVRDTGIGIPAASLQRIFEAFIQVDASSTREYGGVGLGLAITRRLVDSMGGRIWVESEPGRGSTFYFTVTFGVTSHHGAS